MRPTLTLSTLALAGAVAGCANEQIADMDEVFYDWDDRRLLCGVSIDDALGNDLDSIAGGVERARERGEVLVLYAHEPGDDLSVDRLASILSLIDDAGVDYITFADLADGNEPRAGVAITFDDSKVDAWHDTRELFLDHGGRATFFVTRFHRLGDARLDKLRELRADGHAIESHGHLHLHGPDYAEELGVNAYVTDEVLPGLRSMRQAGFDPRSFAYPFGYRTGQLDRAILKHVELVQYLTWSYGYPLNLQPVPLKPPPLR